VPTVVWATGFRPSYPWLRVPVLDDRGELRQDRGVTAADGLYVLGLPFMRTRKSSFIDGVGHDARVLAGQIGQRLGQTRSVAA
jgi:putative flavoprotein involved in K+ transport